VRLAFLSIGRHIHTERWMGYFAARGHECHLLTVQPGPLPGITVHDITASAGPKPWRYLVTLRRVRALLADLRPDLLNTHFLTGYGYWGHFSGFHPNLLTVWGDDVYVTPHENALKNWLARRALASCDALTGDSADILRHAVRLGADPCRSYRVLWGVDFTRFRPAAASQFRRAIGVEDQDLLYFSPRSYTQPYYNIDVIIAAAARVRGAQTRARFLFSGYEGDPQPFIDRAHAAGLGDSVRVLGRIPHDQFADALNAADVFISVPSVDATAVSLLEAMSCGRAIIVSSLASSLEWVDDGQSALVVPPRDVAALEAAMLRLGADAQLRARLGDAALGRARADAGFAENMAHVEGIIRHLVAGESTLPTAVSLTALDTR
jgi:glycosyltransferase involved in cell wall biosynthesis